MIAVIFEVWPAEGRAQEYLDIAAELRPELEKIDGFVSIERFESIYEPGKYLSLSVFRDEAAVRARSEEHTSELQSLMRISYAVFCLKKKKKNSNTQSN